MGRKNRVFYLDSNMAYHGQVSTLPEVAVKVVWLYCKITENHERDQQRVPEDQMLERVDIVNKELADCN